MLNGTESTVNLCQNFLKAFAILHMTPSTFMFYFEKIATLLLGLTLISNPMKPIRAKL